MPHNTQKGSVVIYIVLMMFLMMTSAAVILSGVLNRHIRSAQDYLSAERAFAAANSGMEQVLYTVAKTGNNNPPAITGTINYTSSTDQATYSGSGQGVIDITGTKILPCIGVSGTYKDLVRRVTLGEGVQGCTPP